MREAELLSLHKALHSYQETFKDAVMPREEWVWLLLPLPVLAQHPSQRFSDSRITPT